MCRSVILSCLTLLAAGLLAPAQYRYHWYHEAHRRAYPERPEELVRSWYEKFLNREPDPDGLATWAGAIRNGQPPEQVLAGILNSDEYYAKAGNSPEGFIETLFQDVVGRRPTDREFDYWVRRAYRESRTDVAYALLARYPQSWQTEPYYPDSYRYDYRRPTWPYRR